METGERENGFGQVRFINFVFFTFQLIRRQLNGARRWSDVPDKRLQPVNIFFFFFIIELKRIDMRAFDAASHVSVVDRRVRHIIYFY